MTKNVLLDVLKEFTETVTKDLIMPLNPQKGETVPQYRNAEVFKMRLPVSSEAKKKAPYIIHQVITGKDNQIGTQNTSCTAVIRSIFCVYNEDEQEGALMLLNLMERLRIALLKQRVIGKQFALDMESGIEYLIYPDDTAPFFAGEMVSTWLLPRIEREVIYE